MKIVADPASNLSPQRNAELNIEVVPFHIKLMGKTYRDGIDITPEALYRIYIQHPHEYSTTSQPSVGDFVSAYEKFSDEEILSVHLSSGLSGTYSSAVGAANIISPDQITVFDSKLIGPGLGWMVEVAAHGAKSGWSKKRIINALVRIRENSLTMATFLEMRYLIHSGRVSHLKGVLASVLKIKPIIGIDIESGEFIELGKEMTMGRAARKMAKFVHRRFGKQKLHIQLLHGSNLRGVEMLREALQKFTNCVEGRLVTVTPALGAHSGPTVFGMAAIPSALLSSLLEG